MELLILSQMKFENISEFSLIILVGISEHWDSLFSFSRLISVSICLLKTNLPKTKNIIAITFSIIFRMLGCFSYLRLDLWHFQFLIGSKSEYWELLRFFTILPKKLLKTSAVPFSVFPVLPLSQKLILYLALDFSDSEGFAVFQKSLLLKNFSYQKVFLYIEPQ